MESLNVSAVEKLKINLEYDIHEQYQYQPGEIMQGKIGITFYRDTVIRTIYIAVHGEGAVAWEDQYYGGFQANEIYINATKVLVDKHDTKPLFLKKGSHVFDFDYQIPYNVPSSFNGKYGTVTYVLKAIVQGEKTGDTSITNEPFFVLSRSPLPEYALHGTSQYIDKHFRKGLSFGKIKIKVAVSRTGGVPGEDFLIHANIANTSPLRVIAIQGALIMNSAYHAQHKTIEFHQIINKRRDEHEVTFGDGRKWQNVRLTVPRYIPESKLDQCNIIEVHYVVEFRVEISGSHDIVAEFPVLIGTAPAGLQFHPENKSESNTWGISSNNSHFKFNDKDICRHGYDRWDAGVSEQDNPYSTINSVVFDQESHHGHYHKHHKHHHHHHHHHHHYNPEDLPEIMEYTKL